MPLFSFAVVFKNRNVFPPFLNRLLFSVRFILFSLLHIRTEYYRKNGFFCLTFYKLPAILPRLLNYQTWKPDRLVPVRPLWTSFYCCSFLKGKQQKKLSYDTLYGNMAFVAVLLFFVFMGAKKGIPYYKERKNKNKRNSFEFYF